MTEEIMGFGAGSGINWTMCKQSASHSRQITTPTPHHSIFTGWMLSLTPDRVKTLKAQILNYRNNILFSNQNGKTKPSITCQMA